MKMWEENRILTEHILDKVDTLQKIAENNNIYVDINAIQVL